MSEARQPTAIHHASSVHRGGHGAWADDMQSTDDVTNESPRTVDVHVAQKYSLSAIFLQLYFERLIYRRGVTKAARQTYVITSADRVAPALNCRHTSRNGIISSIMTSYVTTPSQNGLAFTTKTHLIQSTLKPHDTPAAWPTLSPDLNGNHVTPRVVNFPT